MRFSSVGVIALTSLLAACTALSSEDDSTGASTSALADNNTTFSRVPVTGPVAADLANLPGDLRAVAVPGPSNAADFIKDNAAAIRLGKALFWDMQVGSDGVQACASCHFRAGADPRSKNQMSPGLKHVPTADHSFTTGGPNHQLVEADFPLTRLAVPPGSPGFPFGQRGALGAGDSNDVVSSQGVQFLQKGNDPDGFQVGKYKTRRVEPRNTPSVINAVYNHRQFWDGRAENVFNGVNHVGARDPNARVLRSDDPSSDPTAVQVALINSSLASQAVAPIVSDLEMAAPGTSVQDVARRLAKNPRTIGKRVHPVRPLGKQKVSKTDSVLGAMSRYPHKGLDAESYDDMVQAAFNNVWWDSKKVVRVNDDGSVTFLDPKKSKHRCNDEDSEDYTLLQYNFALFFGLAIQAYEATLISDDTPWDRFRRNHPTAADPALNPWTNTNPDNISRLALWGATLFNDRTRGPTNIRCSNCHESNEMTDASVRRVGIATVNGPVRNRDGNIIDKGFNNIGIRPTDNDLGNGGSDAFGKLSLSSRRFPTGVSANVNQACTTNADCPATFTCLAPANLCAWDGTVLSKGFGNEGAFKVPSLRNVALTAPYFHNGDVRSLRDAVSFYSRGGNVSPINQTTGELIEPVGVPNLTEDEVDAIVAYLEALTDARVPAQSAPFDHPQLFVPNGHKGNETKVKGEDKYAEDLIYEVKMVGAAGGDPIPGFLEGPFR